MTSHISTIEKIVVNHKLFISNTIRSCQQSHLYLNLLLGKFKIQFRSLYRQTYSTSNIYTLWVLLLAIDAASLAASCSYKAASRNRYSKTIQNLAETELRTQNSKTIAEHIHVYSTEKRGVKTTDRQLLAIVDNETN